jgi:peptidyl-prolyl cis-trans isomerase SurA
MGESYLSPFFERGNMKVHVYILPLLLVGLSTATAQVASHAPTQAQAQPSPSAQAASKPVARVNGAVLTDRDLLREMFTIFPYARQHNGGVPKEMEPQIRNGGMQMIIFEELVYQEAVRRKLSIAPSRLQSAEADFRKQFPSPQEYQDLLQSEFHGSRQLLRAKIQRSLLIESLLKAEIESKSAVLLAEVHAFYDKNPERFQYPESFAFQTISVLPPQNPTPAQLKEMRKRAEDALRQAKAAKNYEEFGVLAEKISDDDYRVMMGDHRAVDRSKLAPQVVQTLLAMQPGEISDVIPVDQAFTIIRLNKHILAGKMKFEEVQVQLRKELKVRKTNQLRSALDKKLRQNAKIEIL